MRAELMAKRMFEEATVLINRGFWKTCAAKYELIKWLFINDIFRRRRKLTSMVLVNSIFVTVM